jgi:hypothetical protein
MSRINLMASFLLVEEFSEWLLAQDTKVRTEILGRMRLVEERGPQLGRPYVDVIQGSIYPNMKEMRIQIGGHPWRVLFAFDPLRRPVALAGGNKGGNRRWYRENVPIAEARFGRHLAQIEEERGTDSADHTR